MLGKKSSQKIAKYRFLYKHEYRDQTMVEKTRETIIPETPIVPAKKCWEKNSRKILRKNVFYIHTNIVNKTWWKKRAKLFFQKHTNSACKKCWEKIIAKKCEIVRAKNVRKKRRKNCEKTFFIFTRIS